MGRRSAVAAGARLCASSQRCALPTVRPKLSPATSIHSATWPGWLVWRPVTNHLGHLADGGPGERALEVGDVHALERRARKGEPYGLSQVQRVRVDDGAEAETLRLGQPLLRG